MIKNNRLLAASTAMVLGSTLLTGCGGGEILDQLLKVGGVDLHAPALTSEQRAAVAGLHSYCSISEPLRSSSSLGEWTLTSDRDLYSVGRNPIASSNYAQAQITMNATEVGNHDGVMLEIPMQDIRARKAPYAALSGTMLDRSSRMGVMIPAALNDNYIGCLRHAHSYGSVQSPSPARSGKSAIQPAWRSHLLGAVPIEQLQGTPVDGFEFAANFQPLPPSKTFFTVPKAALRSPETTSICSYTTKGSLWSCSIPTRMDTATNWVFVLDQVKPGVHVLVSSQPQSGG